MQQCPHNDTEPRIDEEKGEGLAKEIEKASLREVDENLSHSGQSLNQGSGTKNWWLLSLSERAEGRRAEGSDVSGLKPRTGLADKRAVRSLELSQYRRGMRQGNIVVLGREPER